MVEKLRLVLRIPKLRLGVKAIALFFSFYFLPTWVAGILASIFYFMPLAFSVNFLGTFISFLFLLTAISFDNYSLISGLSISFFSGLLFFLLLGVKNLLFTHRSFIFFFLAGAITFIALWVFFLDIISLPIVALIVFLVYREAFILFTPFPEKSPLLAAVLSFFATQLSWAVFYLNIPAGLATVAIFLVFSGVLYAVLKYFNGELFKSDAPFIAVACGIVSFIVFIFALF